MPPPPQFIRIVAIATSKEENQLKTKNSTLNILLKTKSSTLNICILRLSINPIYTLKANRYDYLREQYQNNSPIRRPMDLLKNIQSFSIYRVWVPTLDNHHLAEKRSFLGSPLFRGEPNA